MLKAVLFNKDPTAFKFVEEGYLSKIEKFEIETFILHQKFDEKTELLINSTDSNKSIIQK